jgi:hypothetical protein
VRASLPAQFTEAQAAKKLGISMSLLRRERARGRVHPIRYGERVIRYTDEILIEYQQLCRNGLDKLASTGSANDPAPTGGVERGLTPALGRQDAHHLAQAIFKRPK